MLRNTCLAWKLECIACLVGYCIICILLRINGTVQWVAFHTPSVVELWKYWPWQVARIALKRDSPVVHPCVHLDSVLVYWR